jgi:hypothetical protein
VKTVSLKHKIPANSKIKEFYVQYDPKPSMNTPFFSVTLSPPAMLQQHYTYSHNQTMNSTANTTYGSSHSQQPELLLEQVPPGVSAGMMLHLEIPDDE